MNQKKSDAETIMVRPLDRDVLLRVVEKLFKKEEGVILRTDNVALVDDNVITDNECCYEFLDKKLIGGAVVMVYTAPIYVDKKTKTGETYSSQPAFFVDFNETIFKDLFPKKKTLKEYMDSRYNYNPRIKKNTEEFIKAYNQ